MRQLVILFALFAFSAVPAFAQYDFDVDVSQMDSGVLTPEGHFRPTANSPTAMRRCGENETSIANKGYVAYVLPAPMKVTSMAYCVNGDKKISKRTNRLGRKYGHREIILAAGVTIYINPKAPGDGYAAGCLNHFYGYPPQAPPPPPPPATPTPTPPPPPSPTPSAPRCKDKNLTYEEAKEYGFTITEDGRCIRPDAPPPPPAEECVDCPKNAKLKAKVSGKSRIIGGKTGLVISAGASLIGSKAMGSDWNNAIKAGAVGAGMNRVANAANPSPDEVTATCGDNTRTFRKGKAGSVGDCEVSWEGNTAILSHEGKVCYALNLPKNLNITTTMWNRKKTKKIEPVKTQSPATTPVHPATNPPGVNNQIPGGGVPISNAPGTTVPTRPRRPTS